VSRIRTVPVWFSVLVGIMFGCGDGSTGPRRGVTLDVVSGDHQSAPPGTELPNALVVRVTDANGQPVRGQIVNFRVTSGGGSMFAGAGSTNNEGVVRDRWTLGAIPGEQTAEARAVDNETGAAIVFATFAATAADTTTPAFRSVRILGGGGQTAVVGSRLPQPVVFLILDQSEKALAGFTFTLRSLRCTLQNGLDCFSNQGDDQLANPTLTTGPDGTATFTGWTLGLTAGAKCLGLYPGTSPPRGDSDVGWLAVCATAVGGPVTELMALTSPISESLITVNVFARDQLGNFVNGVPVTFVPSAGGSVSPAVDTTRWVPSSGDGQAFTTWKLGVPPNTLTITAGSVSITIGG
jgi:hypothetical protein